MAEIITDQNGDKCLRLTSGKELLLVEGKVYVDRTSRGATYYEWKDGVLHARDDSGPQSNDTAAAEGDLTPAQRRMQRWRGDTETPLVQTRPRAHRVDIVGEDEPFYVIDITPEDLALIGLYSVRKGSQRVNLLQPGQYTAMSAAAFFVCCVKGPEDFTPYFSSFAEACDFAGPSSPQGVKTVVLLYNAITALNPLIVRDIESDVTVDGPEFEEAGDADPLES